ncbi:MAG: hypothetical protein NTV29_07505 [Planctomycetota bacterium]|nr:hypothetical protein [Planctomycetota bacterium]
MKNRSPIESSFYGRLASVALARVALARVACWVLALCTSATVGWSQEFFALRLPGTAWESAAKLSAEELLIRDQAGQTTVYSRLRRYDTPDGALIGYGSRQAQRVIQWPAANRGNMRIGILSNGQIEFTPSRMAVFAMDPTNAAGLPQDFSNRPQVASSGVGESGELSKTVLLSTGEAGNRWFMKAGGQGQLQWTPSAANGAPLNDPQGAWMITPVGSDMVRIQQSIGNQWLALSADSQQAGNFGNLGGVLAQSGQRSSVRLMGVNQSIAQCWRLQPFNGGYCFESVMMPGCGLTYVPNSGLWLQPILYSPWQIWWPQQPAFALPAPSYRVVSEQVVANAPLGPISLRIANTHSDGLLVLLADRRNTAGAKRIRIPQGGSETVLLERDSGSTVLQTVEWVDGLGNWDRRQIQVPVPPVVLYDVSVYEEFLQSIAIDATGKSPNVIEDINYQPRSVGFLLLPAGDQLQDNSVIDVYPAAADSKNPGAVRRLAPSDYNRSSSQAAPKDPLKELLEQLQSKRGAF